ncbi:MAG: hypothetical protein P8171_15035 [Candidatus Thiodiazotropha sp.]|jgi:hypothetical protein
MRAILLGLLILTACSHPSNRAQDITNPYLPPSVGDRVSLLEPLTLLGETTRIFLQDGKAMTLTAFDRYKPNCNFEVRTLKPEPQTIEPDEFIIKRVQSLMVEVVRHEVPDRGGLMRVGMDDSGSTLVTRGYHLWLESEKQPDVMRLSCRGAFDDMWNATPPSIQEIEQTLGLLARLVRGSLVAQSL